MKPDVSLLTIFNEALERKEGVERNRYLDEACGSDVALRERVEKLLRAHDEAGGFFSQPSKAPPSAQASGTMALPVTEKPGDTIGRYKLLQQIGEGGCGVVYMAEQEEPPRRRAALKLIKLGMDTKEVIARFDAERHALALMDHPNIAQVFDAGATETGRPYFVMELVRGIKLTDFCDEQDLSTEERLGLFIQVCQAIQHAHQKGVIHRDIKPSNILVTVNDGVPVPKVVDFGIAKATQGRLTDQTLFTAFEQFIGTPAYMSPEQAVLTSLDIDTRSDIYSLGVLLYELLTGSTPFDQKELLAAGLDEMRRTIREKEPPRPSTRLSTMAGEALTMTAKHRHTDPPKLIHLVRGDLDWIAMKCLEKDRRRRYETANGLAMDIERHLNCEPVVARPPSRLYEFQRTVRRHKFGFAAAAALIVVLSLGVLASTFQAVRATRAEREQIRLRQLAESKEKKSEQVAKFLKDMLEGVGPSVALGRDTTLLREILDKTAERVGGDLKEQPEVEAELRSTIGAVYAALGQYEKAETMLREALAIRRKFLGTDNLAVARTLGELANVMCGFHHIQRPLEAETLSREALALKRKILGEEHAEVAASLYILANTLYHQGRLAEAEALYRKALTMARSLLGNEHPNVHSYLYALAYVCRYEGKLTEAETHARDALAVARRIYGSEHPKIAQSLNVLSSVLDDQGKLAEADGLGREVSAQMKKLLGKGHPVLGVYLNNVASLLLKEGKVAEYEAQQREWLEWLNDARAQLPADDPQIANALIAWMNNLFSQGKFAEAEPVARECLAIREKRMPNHWPTFNARSMLGGSLLGQKKYAEAEPLLLSAYEGLRQQRDEIPPYSIACLPETIQRLVNLYQETGRPGQAAEWKQKLAEFDQAGAEKQVATPKPQSQSQP